MKLGRFVQDKEGVFHGTVKAYGMAETSLILVPQTSSQGKNYYEITGDPVKGPFDGGAAFIRQKGDLDYLSVALESPVFPAPINAGLFQDKDNPEVYNLIWDRPKPELAPAAQNNATAEAAATNAPQQKRGFFRKPTGATP